MSNDLSHRSFGTYFTHRVIQSVPSLQIRINYCDQINTVQECKNTCYGTSLVKFNKQLSYDFTPYSKITSVFVYQLGLQVNVFKITTQAYVQHNQKLCNHDDRVLPQKNKNKNKNTKQQQQQHPITISEIS